MPHHTLTSIAQLSSEANYIVPSLFVETDFIIWTQFLYSL